MKNRIGTTNLVCFIVFVFQTIFSTVFGSGNLQVNISPSAFLVSNCGLIYLSGWGGTVNQSGNTMVYMAFGQSLVGSNNVPCTAR